MGDHSHFDGRLFGSSKMRRGPLSYKGAGFPNTVRTKSTPRFVAKTSDEIDNARECILDVAENLIRRFGHAKTTMTSIAWELDTSRATLYRFFPTKEAIDEQVCERVAVATLWQVRASLGDDGPAEEQLTRLLMELGRQTSSRIALEPHLHRLFADAFRNQWCIANEYLSYINWLLENIVRKGLATRAFPSGNPLEMTRLISGSMLVFVHPGLRELAGLDDVELSIDLMTHVKALVESITRAG